MKRLTILNIMQVALILQLSLLGSCKDLEVLADCGFDTNIRMIPDKNELCPVPCDRTFNFSNAVSLPENARITWSLKKEGVDSTIILSDPNAESFDHTFTEPGGYIITLDIVFGFEGCDVSDSERFVVGEDPPKAVIDPSQTECTVGQCDITFTSQSMNAATLSWMFPDDPNDYKDQESVTYSFDDRPGTFQVILKATNSEGTDTDTVTITVKPATFILQKTVSDLRNVLCIKENADGSFTAIGNNTSRSYSFELDRDGDLNTDFITQVNKMNSVYTIRTADYCKKVGDRYISLGYALRGTNQDGYLAGFNSNMAAELEIPVRSVNDGFENINDIVPGIGGGFVVCGSNTGESPIGMLFVGLDPSFSMPTPKVLFQGNPFHKVIGMINMGSHYIATGIVSNGSTLEGCYFELDAELNFINGSLTLLGSDFSPNGILKIDDHNFILFGQNGNTGIVKLIGSTPTDRNIGNSHFNKAMITHDNRLALVGYTGSSASKNPLLMVLDLPDLKSAIIINKPYPVPNGEFFCVEQTVDGGFVMGGTIENEMNYQVLVVRTNAQGTM